MCTLVQALRLCTGRTSCRGSSGMSLPFLHHGTRRGEGSASRPGRSLPPGKARYPLRRRLGGPQGRSGQLRKISPSPGFDPRTVQPIASRYTDWATGPTKFKIAAHKSGNSTLVCKGFFKNSGENSAIVPWYYLVTVSLRVLPTFWFTDRTAIGRCRNGTAGGVGK